MNPSTPERIFRIAVGEASTNGVDVRDAEVQRREEQRRARREAKKGALALELGWQLKG